MYRVITVLFITCSAWLPAQDDAPVGKAVAGLDVATVQEFDILDRDRNGSLSEREFSFSEVAERLYLAGKRDMVVAVFQSIDTDNSGGIELMELSRSAHNRNARLLDRAMSRAFIKADINQDGTISLEEYSTRASANLDLFGKIDLNDNKKIGPFEWIHELKKSGMDQTNAVAFALLDQNDDGSISSAEYAAGEPPEFLKNAFEAIDLNGNREIGPGEYSKAIALPEGRLGIPPDLIALFESIDRNRDQRISLREFERFTPMGGKRPGPGMRGKGHMAELIFGKIDTNDDRSISLIEFAASNFRGMKGKGKGRK